MAAKAGAVRLAYRGLDDALATALMVSGVDRGIHFSQPGLDSYSHLVISRNENTPQSI